MRYPEDVEAHGYGGAVDGHEGVKLEEQVLVTDHGVVPLSSYRYESPLLA